MTRAALFATLISGVLAVSSRADVPVAPPPRPAGTPVAPPSAPAKAEDPAETVGKIIKNSKDVTDKLSKKDTGADTRKTQDDTLALIDSLINRQDDPPPDDKDKKDDQKQDKSDDKKDDQKQKSDDQPKDGKGGQKGMKDDGGMPQPKGGGMGGGQPKSGRKPRAESGSEPGGQQKQPGGMKDGGKQAKSGGQKGKDGTAGTTAGESSGGKPPKATLPVDDDVAKDVWGHLPDKLRQQVTQYYKEEFMPRYADLLKQYYSSLSEKGAKPDK